MPVAAGTLFQIQSAIDTAHDPTLDSKNNDAAKNSGRLIEVEDENVAGDDDSGWQRRDREAARCLKLGLQKQNSGNRMFIGIELERINWNGPVENLPGKMLRISGPITEYQGNILMLTGKNCQVLEGAAPLAQQVMVPPTQDFDFIDDDILREVIDIDLSDF